MASKSVCDVLLEILADAGVEHVFGIPGDAINALVDSVRRQERIRFVQVRHEEAGAFAASAQAKLTGALAVCVGTAGPGAVHLLNGLYDAKMDHAPVLAITGQVETPYIGTDYHQEVDLDTVFKDVAVFSETVMTPEQMPDLVEQAARKAIAHRSVAHISIPADVASRTVPRPDRRSPVTAVHAETVPCADDLRRASEILNHCRRPALLAGVGCLGASQQLIEAADRLGAPIVRTLRAKEVIADTHPLCVGGLGQLGGRPGVEVMESCDALLLAGTDFPYRNFFPDDVQAIQIDVDPTRIGKRYPVAVGLVGHAGPTLSALSELLNTRDDRSFLDAAQSSYALSRASAEDIETDNASPIRPQRVARAISENASDDAIFVCDTGAVTVWGARHLALRGDQRFTLSSSLASMAFAMPGAIGAQLAYPDRQVIALAGDGGFSMLMADFLTAAKYELPINVVVFNNRKLGLIKFEQEANGLPEFQTELHNLDYAAFARLCGGEGATVSAAGDLEEALKSAFQSTKPWLVDVAVNPNEIPMPPSIMLSQAVGFGVAKIKELFGG